MTSGAGQQKYHALLNEDARLWTLAATGLETRWRTLKPKGQAEERVSKSLEDLARVAGILASFWKEV